MPDFKWRPIKPLSEADRGIDLSTMRPLYEAWWASKEQVQDLSRHELEQFNQRLVRRLSVETGILERLYELDRGTTEALVAKGFAEELISHSSTDIEPAALVDILRDHEAAIHLILDGIAGKRALTKGFLHELHSILTRHQQTTTAIDQFGNRIDIPLVRGKFKEHPNNPRRHDGSIHEYCPPIHVDSEIDHLLELYQQYQKEDPILIAGWLHHRFTQIHPYQDGNGRLARAIVTMALLQRDLLPLVIERDRRSDYLGALEAADAGDLSPLVGIFERFEKDAILQALSLDVDAEVSHQQSLVSAAISNLRDKFNRRRAIHQAQLLKVNDVALKLRDLTKEVVSQRFSELREALLAIGGASAEPRIDNGGTDFGTSHWYKYQVSRTARDARKFANFQQNHYFTKASIQLEDDRLVFVVSFHHVGNELTGVMEATAFAQFESLDESDEHESFAENFRPCSFEPFAFTYTTNPEDVRNAFLRWLDADLAIAFGEFGDRL